MLSHPQVSASYENIIIFNYGIWQLQILCRKQVPTRVRSVQRYNVVKVNAIDIHSTSKIMKLRMNLIRIMFKRALSTVLHRHSPTQNNNVLHLFIKQNLYY